MKKVCAWCGKKLAGGGTEVSHGICPKCFSAILQVQFEFAEQLPALGHHPRRKRATNGAGTQRGPDPRQADLEFEPGAGRVADPPPTEPASS